MVGLPQRQRVAAYAVILRDGDILLSRLAASVTPDELWTLPGGGLDHGEDPRDAVVREIHEETGLEATVGETARVYSAHLPGCGARGDGWTPTRCGSCTTVGPRRRSGARVLEVGGSTVEAAWKPVSAVLDGRLVAAMVLEALADHRPSQLQRLAAYAFVTRDAELLLTRISPGATTADPWTLPGGGVEHGESPRSAVVREVREECGSRPRSASC